MIKDSGPKMQGRTTDTGMEVCPACCSKLVYPVSWRELDDEKWYLTLRCPDCEFVSEGVYTHREVSRFDHVLNMGSDKLVQDLEMLSNANMRKDVELISAALEKDAIWPEDF